MRLRRHKAGFTPVSYEDQDIMGLLGGGTRFEPGNAPPALAVKVKTWVPQEILQACEVALSLGYEGTQRMICNLLIATAILGDDDDGPAAIAQMHYEAAKSFFESEEEAGRNWHDLVAETLRVLDQVIAEIREFRNDEEADHDAA